MSPPRPRGRQLLLYDGTLSSLAQCRALASAVAAKNAAASLHDVAQPEDPQDLAPLEAHVPLSRFASIFPPWMVAVAAEVLHRPLLGVNLNGQAEQVLDEAVRTKVDTIIACGRRTAALSIGIKRALQDHDNSEVINVQILNPRFGSFLRERYFNAVVTPQHDNLKGRNVFSTTGALTWVNPQSLAVQRQHETSHETEFLRPGASRRLVVLLGGSTARKEMETPVIMEALSDIFKSQKNNFDEAFVIGSRRTPDELAGQLIALESSRQLGSLPVRVWMPTQSSSLSTSSSSPSSFSPSLNQDKNRSETTVRDILTLQTFNPYRASLARGDAFVVTADSVSIVSDACSTGKPVFVLQKGVDGGEKSGSNAKLWRFHDHLLQMGIVTNSINDLGKQKPEVEGSRMNDAEEAAAFILAQMSSPL